MYVFGLYSTMPGVASTVGSEGIIAPVFSGSDDVEISPYFGVAVPGVSFGVVTISKGILS
jgi:hypothetical protein